jgi:hypothetical protein
MRSSWMISHVSVELMSNCTLITLTEKQDFLSCSWYPATNIIRHVGELKNYHKEGPVINNMNSHDQSTVPHIHSGTGSHWLSDSTCCSPCGSGWHEWELCMSIWHANITLITSTLDGGVGDSLWNVGHQFHVHMAHHLRRLNCVLSPWKLQIMNSNLSYVICVLFS